MGVSGIMSIKNVKKQFKKLEFSLVFEQLEKQNYCFSFENLTHDFPGIDSQTMYLFLMFLNSQKETPDIHLIICKCLYFMEPYMVGADNLIKWHLTRALEISPNNQDVLKNWIFGIYAANPDCPFTDLELKEYRQRLNIADSKNERTGDS